MALAILLSMLRFSPGYMSILRYWGMKHFLVNPQYHLHEGAIVALVALDFGLPMTMITLAAVVAGNGNWRLCMFSQDLIRSNFSNSRRTSWQRV